MSDYGQLKSEYSILATRNPSCSNETLRSDDTELLELEITPFSWIDYSLCLLLGVGILWTWQAIIGAASFFQGRFQSYEWILLHSESTMIAVFSSFLLGSTIILINCARPSYPTRIYISLIAYVFTSLFLALSSIYLLEISGAVYFGFVLTLAGCIGIANGLSQNGVFALVTGFGQARYTQAVLLGSAFAGIFPPISQILAFYWNIASTQKTRTQDFSQVKTLRPILYFFFATGVRVATLLAFSILILRRRPQKHLHALQYLETYESMGNNRKPLQHSLFFKKSYLLALALFFCFIITTLSPVFASKIQSVKLPMAEFSISQPTIFIGTAFLTWNIGELLGSFVPLLPFTSLKRPEIIFGVSVSRIGFIVLYNVCNLNGRGAVVGGDIFYLVVVQGLSGLTSGWVATAAMIGASQWETEAERQKAGTFMVLYLIAGLAAGGFLSFTIT